MTYKAYDVVKVPFPFTDSIRRKRRPALVLSSFSKFNHKIGHSVMAMITSAKNTPWPLDTKISNLAEAGLPAESVIRMKFFTLDHRFVLGQIGTLANEDKKAFGHSIQTLLEDIKS